MGCRGRTAGGAGPARLAAILKGKTAPKDNAEPPGPGGIVLRKQRRFAAAARLAAEALEIDPKLGDDFQAPHRRRAAGLAFLAGVGQGEDDPRPDEAARQRFRAQARDWLRADLGLCSKKLDANEREALRWPLVYWLQCNDLAGIRDATALAKLPEPERKEWQSLWAQSEALQKIQYAMITQELGHALASAANAKLDEASAPGYRARRSGSSPSSPKATKAWATP